MALYAVESALPPIVPIPGIKLGLANIITLVVLWKYSAKMLFRASGADSFSDPVLRSGHQSPVQSLRRSPVPSGNGICATAVAWTLSVPCKYDRSCFHNLGQIGVAFLLTSVPAVLVYLPFYC